MNSSTIVAKYILNPQADGSVEILTDHAIHQQEGVITDIGPIHEMVSRHPSSEQVGGRHCVAIPGLVNAHHHVGLSGIQLGSPETTLEAWWGLRVGNRPVDPYLDALYSGIQMLQSGVTTVQHLDTRRSAPLASIQSVADAVIRAYSDRGMRVSDSYGVRDQNWLVYFDEDKLFSRLSSEHRATVQDYLADARIPLSDHVALFRHLHLEHANRQDVCIQLAPENLHWCSDEALEELASLSDEFHVPMHTHVLETEWQREYLRSRGELSTQRLSRLGMLGPKLTLGHCVWVSQVDIEAIAASGAHLCHNPSSNLRLRSGIAPLPEFLAAGAGWAIGIDSTGINDDHDMLQEMRLVNTLHRRPGLDKVSPTSSEVLSAATVGGAATTGFSGRIGRLEVGLFADVVLLDWSVISAPFIDDRTPVVEAVLARARREHVSKVLVAGEVVLEAGEPTRMSYLDVSEALRGSLERELTRAESQRRHAAAELYRALLEHYADYATTQDRCVYRGCHV